MTQLGIYQSAVPLTAARHAQWGVQIGTGFGFSGRLNSVPLMVGEFREAAAEYPIAFAGDGEHTMPIGVLGLRQDENLFVSDDQRWLARYRPAFVRRYPFVFATDGQADRFVLCIDEAYAGLDREGKGHRLFDEAGKPTEYVEGILKFLQEYQVQFERTRAFARRLQELGVLSGIEATVPLPGGGNVSLKGMQAVDRAKLKALPAETIAELLASDMLELIYLHLQSLRNLGGLQERMVQRAGTPSTA